MKMKIFFCTLFFCLTVSNFFGEFFISEETTGTAMNSNTVSFRCNVPKVFVYLNGNLQGRTELKIRGLKEGVYSVRLSKHGFRDVTGEISVKNGLCQNFYSEMEIDSESSENETESLPEQKTEEKELTEAEKLWADVISSER